MILINNRYNYMTNLPSINFNCKYIINIFIYLKYFFYFNIFLICLLMNLLLYNLNIKSTKINTCFINFLYFTINLNGAVLIKFVQWIITHLEITNSNTYIIDLFSNLYENCHIHDLNYTKKIFYNEYNLNFDDVIQLDKNFNIKSGSIAQIYKGKIISNLLSDKINSHINDIAIKVVHPEILYQFYFPMKFIKFYKFVVTHIWFMKKYSTIFQFDSFFENLKKQINMYNEFSNIEYYYNAYIDNSYIYIPKPLISSTNVLIMEYVDGNKLSDFDISDIEKQKIIVLLNLFIKNNFMFLDYFHADLHDSNWKVQKYNNMYKLIIYDFGYCAKNNMQSMYKLLNLYTDINNFSKIAELIFNNIVNCNISCDNFIKLFCDNMSIDDNLMHDTVIHKIYKFCHCRGYILNNDILEIFISIILFKKYMDKYLFYHDSERMSYVNYIIQINMFYYNFCNTYDIFYNVKNYIKEYYIDNKTVINLYDYNDNYFDSINTNVHSTNCYDIVENIEI